MRHDMTPQQQALLDLLTRIEGLEASVLRLTEAAEPQFRHRDFGAGFVHRAGSIVRHSYRAPPGVIHDQ